MKHLLTSLLISSLLFCSGTYASSNVAEIDQKVEETQESLNTLDEEIKLIESRKKEALRALSRVALKSALQGGLAYAEKKLDEKQTKKKLDEKQTKTLWQSFKLFEFAELFVDYAADELITTDEQSTTQKVTEWTASQLAKNIVKNKPGLDKNDIRKLVVKMLLAGATKKKLFLSKESDFRKTLEIPTVAVLLTLMTPSDKTGEAHIHKINHVPGVVIGILAESFVENILAPKIYAALGSESKFATFLNKKECRKKLFEGLLSVALQSAVETANTI